MAAKADRSRRYIVHGWMPLQRTPQSGLFATKFKEDAFYLGIDERYLYFDEGARTEQSLKLPIHFVENAYHMRKNFVDSLGLVGGQGKMELYLQYALLPLVESAPLEKLRLEILQKSASGRVKLVGHDPQSSLEVLLLEWCNEPIFGFDYNRTDYSLKIKVRAPLPQPTPAQGRTKRGRLNYYREYESLLCSKAGYYIISAFDKLPFVQSIELTMYQLYARPADKLIVISEQDESPDKPQGLKRVDPNDLPVIETKAELKSRLKVEKLKAKQAEPKPVKLSKAEKLEEKLVKLTSRKPDQFDDIFDGSLPYQMPILSARIPRQGFMDLERSKQSYDPRTALSLFDLRLETDEENAIITPVESFI